MSLRSWKRAPLRPHVATPIGMCSLWYIQAAKNQSHLALAKFEEADKYAPNWGRLHLKWAEAPYYAGKRDQAKQQFAIAAQLDLSQDDAVTLARWRKPGG